MTRRRGGLGSRVADGSLSDVLGRSGQPVGVEDLPNYIDVPVTEAWKAFVAKYGVDIQRLTGTRVDAKRTVLTLSLETLLGIQSGPSPNGTGGKVQLVDANGDPIGQHYDNPLRMSQDRGGTADAALYTRSLIVNPQDAAVQVDLVTSNYRSNNRFPVDASIAGGQGESAADPFYVHVVNQPTPAAGGLEPKPNGYFKAVDCTQRTVLNSSQDAKVAFAPTSRLQLTQAELGGADSKFVRLRALSLYSIVDTIPKGLSWILAVRNCVVTLSSGGTSIGSVHFGAGGVTNNPTMTILAQGVPIMDTSTAAGNQQGGWANCIGPWLAVTSSPIPLAMAGITSANSQLSGPAAVSGTCKVGLHFDVLQTPTPRAA